MTLVVKPQCGFLPRPGTWSLSSLWLLGAAWSLHTTRSPEGFCWRHRGHWTYGIPDPLLQAIRSLYELIESCVRILRIKSSIFLVSVGSCQGCPLSPVWFQSYRISRCSQGQKFLWSLCVSSVRAWFSAWKRYGASLWVRGSYRPKPRSSSILRFCSQSRRWTGSFGQHRVNTDPVSDQCGEERTEPQGKALGFSRIHNDKFLQMQ